nr:hypothetical protein KSU1_C1518 [uncultured bacterium]
MLGMAIGGGVGSALFPSSAETGKPKPAGFEVQTSSYGSAIAYLRGTAKTTGNLLWYGNFQSHEQKEEVGGSMGGEDITTGFTYSVSLALGLCHGPATISRMWVGKRPCMLKLMSDVNGVRTYAAYLYKNSSEAPEDPNAPDPFTPGSGGNPGRFNSSHFIRLGELTCYTGNQTEGDAHIASFVVRPPVWKGLCYVVLENWNLENSPYLPNFQFETSSLTPYVPVPLPYTQHIQLDEDRDSLYAFQDWYYGAAPAFEQQAARIRIFDPRNLQETDEFIYLSAGQELNIKWVQMDWYGKFLFIGSDDGAGHSYVRRFDLSSRDSSMIQLAISGALVMRCACASSWNADSTKGNNVYFGTTAGELGEISVDGFPTYITATPQWRVQLRNVCHGVARATYKLGR